MRRFALAALAAGLVAGCSEPVVFDPGGVTITDESGDPIGSEPVRLRGAPECGADTIAVIEIDHPLGDLERGESRTYVRDPEEVLPPQNFEAPYDPRGALDDEVRFTGYETDRFTIWIGPDSDQYIYLVDGPRVEAWPRVLDFEC